MSLLLALVALTWGIDQGWAQSAQSNKKLKFRGGRVTPAERKAAAKRAKELGLLPGVAGLAAATAPLPGIEGPGGVPHYFGPYGNWAYSPLPKGPVTAVTLVDPGTGYNNPLVTIADVYGTGSGAGLATASVDPTTGAITAITGGLGGADYSAPIVIIEDDPAFCGGALPPCGTGATATASIATTPIGGTLTGGMLKFIDKLPGMTPAGANNLGQYIPIAVVDTTTFQGSHYYEIALVEFYEKMHSDLPPTKMRGYVQLETPGALAAMAAMNPPLLSKHVPVGSGIFAIDKPHYLGPVIVAQGRAHGVPGAAGQPVPVRIKFYNLLPTGAGGDLFIPVDETVPGAGLGPAGPGTAGSVYTQNRGTIHLHGNNTVWISDGNVHQWITPANENTPYPKGVSARNVPDMGNACDAPGSGCQTFFYTNAQSARLQFYHDHAMGITRLNVYAGEAAGYVVTDAVEQDMINGTNVSGVNCFDPPTCSISKKVLPDIGIPMVIQDRTWVEAATIFAQDPTWNWGTGPRDANGNITAAVDGDLWYPHVYMSAQNPWDLTGTNAFGRWHYGPWFNPPVPTCVNGLPVGCIEVGPVPNPYHQADCDLVPPGLGCTAPWEPLEIPGAPNPSTPGEAFMDTPTVNGTAYPYLEVEPKAYRFRVLNAANDRMFNLQLYVAADKTSPTTADTNYTLTPARLCDGVSGALVSDCTEVKMIPVGVAPANQYADWPSGIPDPATKGPAWIQIGTEGGFMARPVVVPQQPIGWNLNPTTFNFGNVNQHSLLLGSAERADVIVDFTNFAGKTLILYNDAPAAFPAGVPVYDYFTGVANQMDTGGAPTTQPGYGPNTRTIMQIRVTKPLTTPTPDVTLANLQTVFAKTASKRGVFEVSQDPIIIPQAAFNSAYNNTFPATAAKQYIQIAETSKTFQPIDETGALQPAVTLPLEMKAMHDEMGGVYDTLFGRMSGMLGLTNPTSPVHVLIPYGLASPPTDIVKGSVEGTPIGVMPDGTQIWRIFHNGVDTHTIHTHLFHTQLINRLGQDGILLPNDPIELGWKDTFRVNPLEITYLAMRPTVPTPAQLPFEAPDSVRLIDPTLPEGATLIPPPPAGWFDPDGVAIPEILNHYVNFGWEYVWHCHILAHEEMDMMHSLVFAVPPRAPELLSLVLGGTTNNPRVNLTWTDNSLKETQFTIQRASNANFTTGLRTFTVAAAAGSGTNVAYTDTTVSPNNTYWYRVFAIGAPVGDTQAYPGSLGFPTMSADSVSGTQSILVGAAPGTPTAPTNLTATLQTGPQVSLTWMDNATNETGFVVERCSFVAPATTCSNFAQIATPGPRNNTGNVTYVDTTVAFGNSYLYRVAAVNSASVPPYTYVTLANAVIVPAIPPAPTSFTVSAVKANGNNYTAMLDWASSVNPTSFTIQRATNATFTTGLTTSTVAGNLRTTTQTVTRNTTYYYRIRANNNVGGSSAWVNALPFPIRTGP
jgi:FtsP/CotA-like multicopper oxidase with cupredoxin domain